MWPPLNLFRIWKFDCKGGIIAWGSRKTDCIICDAKAVPTYSNFYSQFNRNSGLRTCHTRDIIFVSKSKFQRYKCEIKYLLIPHSLSYVKKNKQLPKQWDIKEECYWLFVICNNILWNFAGPKGNWSLWQVSVLFKPVADTTRCCRYPIRNEVSFPQLWVVPSAKSPDLLFLLELPHWQSGSSVCLVICCV